MLPASHCKPFMKTEGFRHTMRGTMGGHTYVVTITSPTDEVFHYSAMVDGVDVDVRERSVIRNKGDAMQLALAAVERHIADLSHKIARDSTTAS